MSKPKILMIADKKNWVFDYTCKVPMDMLGDKYDFDIAYYLESNVKSIDHTKYDLIYNIAWRKLKGFFPAKKTIKGVWAYSLGDWDFWKNNYKILKEYVIGDCCALNCGALQLYEDFIKMKKDINLPDIYYATAGIDVEKFSPSYESRDGLVVCWTGNPDREFKGFRTHVEPAIKKAQEIYPDIKLETAFTLHPSELPDFYKKCDVLLLASKGDGGPLSFIEAGASGLPAISTAVGFAYETIKDGENGIFVNRNVDEMVKALIKLRENPGLLCNMSRKIREDIACNWNFRARSIYWDRMFKGILDRR